jgi:hypothetical protein
MNTITPPQLMAIHVLLSKAGLSDKDDKKSAVRHFTSNRTESSREMYREEARALIEHLKRLDNTAVVSDKMRKKLLSLAHEMDWRKEGTKSIDMDRINNWCIKYGYLHKKLDAYKHNELPKLLTQFEGVYKDFISKLK